MDAAKREWVALAASQALAAGAIWFALTHHLTVACLCGMLVFGLSRMAGAKLAKLAQGAELTPRARALGLAAVIGGACALAALASLGVWHLARSPEGVGSLLGKMAQALDGLRASLPGWAAERLPDGAEATREAIAAGLRERAQEVSRVGLEGARGLGHALIGVVGGAMVAWASLGRSVDHLPLGRELMERAGALQSSFEKVVFAQVKISAVNALLTGLFLLVALPLFGVKMPLAKTLVAFTFVVGLIPVAGNLISNTAIVVIGAGVSLPVALACLGFLVLVHKLEYFLNARIVGQGIGAAAWELVLALIAMEAAFGIPGLIAAPVVYAYAKGELRRFGWVGLRGKALSKDGRGELGRAAESGHADPEAEAKARGRPEA